MTTLTVSHAVRRVANRENVSNDSTSVMLLSFKVKRASGIDLEEYSFFIESIVVRWFCSIVMFREIFRFSLRLTHLTKYRYLNIRISFFLLRNSDSLINYFSILAWCLSSSLETRKIRSSKIKSTTWKSHIYRRKYLKKAQKASVGVLFIEELRLSRDV